MGRLFVSVCEYPLINPDGIGSFSPATAGYGGDHGGKIVRQCVRVSTDQSQRDWIIQPRVADSRGTTLGKHALNSTTLKGLNQGNFTKRIQPFQG